MKKINKIKKIREEYFFMNQIDFAKIIGCTVTTLSRWEQGKFKPSFAHMKKIITVLQKHGITITHDDIV